MNYKFLNVSLFQVAGVMWLLGLSRESRGERRRLTRYSTRGATVPRVLFTAAAARAARALGEAGRGASPTAGKREGISF